jgi:hypothetical protein
MGVTIRILPPSLLDNAEDPEDMRLRLALRRVMFEQTLTKQKDKVGPHYPDTLTSMNNLAAAYRASKQLDRAGPLFEELLPRSCKKLGPGIPEWQSTAAALDSPGTAGDL